MIGPEIARPLLRGGRRTRGAALYGPLILFALLHASPAPCGRVELEGTPRGIFFLDADGDGRDEPILAREVKGGCVLSRIASPMGEARLEAVGTPVSGDGTHGLLLVDADLDGTADLAHTDRQALYIRKGTGNLSFASESRRVSAAGDLLLPQRGCEPSTMVPFDVRDDGAPEILVPILGGVRALSLSASEEEPIELMLEPRILPASNTLQLASALPTRMEVGTAPALALGPMITGAASRLEFAWWTRREPDGALIGRRSAFAIPAREVAVLSHQFDLEGDGRPEIAVITMPARLESFLDEYRLHVFRATDRADVVTLPFYSVKTNLNFWQMPVVTHRTSPDGADLLLAFYRGLMTDHLNVEVIRANGAGSFEAKPRDFEIASRKGANRNALFWVDVDRDGLEDLVTQNETGVLVHKGRPDRAKPVEPTPSWSAATYLGSREVSIDLSSDGRFQLKPPRGPIRTHFRDLDGDKVPEIIVIKDGEVSLVSLRSLGGGTTGQARPSSPGATGERRASMEP